MTIRTSRTTVTFAHAFTVDSIDGQHPAGTYDVDTDEELIEDLSFLAWRRVATSIHIPKNGSTEMHRIDPAELDAILMSDGAGATSDSQRLNPDSESDSAGTGERGGQGQENRRDNPGQSG